MNSHTKKLNNRRPSQRHTKTGNQEKVSCFFSLIFGVLKKLQYCPMKRETEHALFWQFLIFGGVGNERKMKKFLKIPAYPDLCGVVKSKEKFSQINVHSAFCWFVGIGERFFP